MTNGKLLESVVEKYKLEKEVLYYSILHRMQSRNYFLGFNFGNGKQFLSIGKTIPEVKPFEAEF
jgi:hypothetical protein